MWSSVMTKIYFVNFFQLGIMVCFPFSYITLFSVSNITHNAVGLLPAAL